MNAHLKYTLAAFAIACTSSVSAAYIGPSDTPSYQTVKQINANPVDDAPVTLQGFIIKQLRNDKYLFSDGTGEIRVDIDHQYFPPQPISDKTKVRLRGEIEKDYLQSPEIDVEAPLEILPQTN
ncbi:NirD/YgiW/YdeI family stress tolerance protein [Thiomicrorhabdus sp.]|uniref:NirD/YgiW/YdeI family stress tolerance protein n=1 Tax=Thiomicrorhabdus sp. TaxID=2039724 RepID=UPI0029C79770|nr:NirD/YgiW/YdeI family stress tolerance protein [Thiomicrorhabdus sp.]